MARILIIDDSSYMRRMIRSILKADGYEIFEAEDGLKGLQMSRTVAPDCILMDLIMPGVDGLKILNVLHEERSNIPVIVLTADIQESVRSQCLELGAVAFINKPPRDNVLLGALKQVFGSRKDAIK
ncbi:MAG TPA: response regulator [Thermodesulfovibrionales bacterium]|nr:response regulator [Thermodesulfovibrionales bacterium]